MSLFSRLSLKLFPHQVTLGSSVKPQTGSAAKGVVAPIGVNAIWFEAEVPEMRDQLIEGRFDFDIIYGRVAKKRYTASYKYKTFIRFNQAGDVEVTEFQEVPPL